MKKKWRESIKILENTVVEQEGRLTGASIKINQAQEDIRHIQREIGAALQGYTSLDLRLGENHDKISKALPLIARAEQAVKELAQMYHKLSDDYEEVKSSLKQQTPRKRTRRKS